MELFLINKQTLKNNKYDFVQATLQKKISFKKDAEEKGKEFYQEMKNQIFDISNIEVSQEK